MIEVVPQNFSPNIWGSPAFKFRLHPKMVRQNVADRNLKAGEPEYWENFLANYFNHKEEILGVILSYIWSL